MYSHLFSALAPSFDPQNSKLRHFRAGVGLEAGRPKGLISITGRHRTTSMCNLEYAHDIWWDCEKDGEKFMRSNESFKQSLRDESFPDLTDSAKFRTLDTPSKSFFWSDNYLVHHHQY